MRLQALECMTLRQPVHDMLAVLFVTKTTAHTKMHTAMNGLQ